MELGEEGRLPAERGRTFFRLHDSTREESLAVMYSRFGLFKGEVDENIIGAEDSLKNRLESGPGRFAPWSVYDGNQTRYTLYRLRMRLLA